MKSRIEFLEALVKNKKIIHLGCCDHLSVIDNNIKSNIWLHKRLTDAANVCLGLDIDENAVNYVRNHIGYENVMHGDIINDTTTAIEENHWDFLVMGEILEHIDNPVQFLKMIRLKYSGIIDNVVITVPNAFRLANFIYGLLGYERANSDHRYWFTPYTLCKVIYHSGMKLKQLNMCEWYSRVERQDNSKKYRCFFYVIDVVASRFPLLSNDIIAYVV